MVHHVRWWFIVCHTERHQWKQTVHLLTVTITASQSPELLTLTCNHLEVSDETKCSFLFLFYFPSFTFFICTYLLKIHFSLHRKTTYLGLGNKTIYLGSGKIVVWVQMTIEVLQIYAGYMKNKPLSTWCTGGKMSVCCECLQQQDDALWGSSTMPVYHIEGTFYHMQP